MGVQYLKQSTAYNVILGPYQYASTGLAHDGLNIDNSMIWLSKMYAAPAHLALSVTLVALTQGMYVMSLGTADTNTRGNLLLWTTKADALPVWQEYVVLSANVFDSWISGTDYLDVNTVQAGGASLGTAADIADAVWDETSTGHTEAGYAGEQLWTDVDAVLADTGTDGVLLAASSVEASTIATGAITSASFAAGAITAAAVADGAIDAATFAASAIEASKIATGALTSAKFAAGALAATAFATGAIASGTFVAGAIDAAAINTDAVAEITAGVLAGLVDGTLTLSVALRNVNAYARGQVDITSNTYTYKNTAGVTIYEHVISPTSRTVT